MIYCYIRKSTDKQFYLRQFDVLKNYGYINGNNCEYREETYTGTKLDRPIYDKLLEDLKENDTIVVESLSRLSRGGLYKTIEEIKYLLEKRKINIKILKENFDFKANEGINASTKMFLGMCSVFAQFERDILSERTKEGLMSRKNEGIKLGRPNIYDLSIEKFINILEEHINTKKSYHYICLMSKIPEATYYRRLKEYKKEYNTEDEKELLNKLKEVK